MKNIVGQKIIEFRRMTPNEIEASGWDNGTDIIVLEDGTVIYPSRDDEGNGPGVLFID